MTDLDFESSQLQLLTDALRAGPGTPEWRAALASIEHAGGGDEYKMLRTARERLASGQRYREVRAGAGFTRKIFDSLDREEQPGASSFPSANLIAAVSALAILGILSVVVWVIMPRSTTAPPPQLAQTYFVNTLSQSDFESEPGMDWAVFGTLGVHADAGLRPMLTNLDKEFRGGGVFYERSLRVDQPFVIEATVLAAQTSDHLAVEVFVSDDANFAGASATSEHELAWLARGSEASVILPGGRVDGRPVRLAPGRTLNVRITINRNEASVEMNGQKLWTGRNDLAPDKPRMAGIRFLAREGAAAPLPVVQSVRLLVPQK